MKHYTEENDAYLIPKMFDRWRYFIKMRKLVGFILNNMQNRLHAGKADMSYAFNRWKYMTSASLVDLDGTERKDLLR